MLVGEASRLFKEGESYQRLGSVSPSSSLYLVIRDSRKISGRL